MVLLYRNNFLRIISKFRSAIFQSRKVKSSENWKRIYGDKSQFSEGERERDDVHRVYIHMHTLSWLELLYGLAGIDTANGRRVACIYIYIYIYARELHKQDIKNV